MTVAGGRSCTAGFAARRDPLIGFDHDAGYRDEPAAIAGQGPHWTVELHGPDWRDWRADTVESPLASRVAARALEAGAVIGTSGEQVSLFLAPPLVISDAEADALLDILDTRLDLADREHNRSMEGAQ